MWAVRMMHEASLHEDNCFLTLTYDDAHLPWDEGLNKKHFQDFMKRLRSRNNGKRIKFFHCGEYGEAFGRPHYHAILFGFDFRDRVVFKEENGSRVSTSAELASLWRFGFSTVGDVSFESAAYVARYVVKKITGSAADDHYWKVNRLTGESVQVSPEYATMSRGGNVKGGSGIASRWFRKFGNEVYPYDEVIVRGHPVKPPRYYDELLSRRDPALLESVKAERRRKARRHSEDQTPARLHVREMVHKARAKLLRRGLEGSGEPSGPKALQVPRCEEDGSSGN